MGETTNEVRPGGDLKNGTSAHISTDDPNSSPGAAEIRSDIEETRSNLSATIDALQDKLDPSRIAEQVKDQIRDKATEAYGTAKHAVKEATVRKVGKIVSSVSETVSGMTRQAGAVVNDKGSSVVQYIKENPVPVALVALGLGMLATSRRQSPLGVSNGGSRLRDTGSSLTDTARSAADRATNVVSSAAGSVREFATGAVDTTRQQLQGVTSQAQQGARAASGRFKNTLQENPMVLGIAALAAGALVGLTLPSTGIESEYLGQARDRLVDQAKSMAQEAAGKVGRVAGEASHTFQETAKKEGLVGG